jgi:hypothetical protein
MELTLSIQHENLGKFSFKSFLAIVFKLKFKMRKA